MVWRQNLITIGRIYLKATSFYKTVWSPTLFTPAFQYFYTDISAISVTFCNSVMVIIVAIMMITDFSKIPSLSNQTVLLQDLKWLNLCNQILSRWFLSFSSLSPSLTRVAIQIKICGHCACLSDPPAHSFLSSLCPLVLTYNPFLMIILIPILNPANTTILIGLVRLGGLGQGDTKLLRKLW